MAKPKIISHSLHRFPRLPITPAQLSPLLHQVSCLALHPCPSNRHLVLDYPLSPHHLDPVVQLAGRRILGGLDLDELDRHAMLAFH